MRMLFATTAGAGHFGPMAPVARALVAAGHQVRVAAPGSFADHVAGAGLEHVPFDDVPPEVMGAVFARIPSMTPEEANATVIREVFGRLDARAAYPRVQQVVDDWAPDVILREPCEFGSLAAAERSGVPHAEVAIGVGRVRVWAGEHLVDPLLELDEIAGLASGTCNRGSARASVLTSVPASLDGDAGTSSSQATIRYRAGPVEAREGSLPAAWGDGDQPLVYVTFGSVTGGLDEMSPVFRGSLEALADLPVRVLLTTGHAGDPEALRPWPDNAHVEQWWPQDEIMPLASAMVGHGGFGTTMTAVAAGVPQIVLPLFASDQEINATRVHEAGAGIRLGGRTRATEHLAEAVTRVLADPAMRAAARGLADEIASLPDISEVVDVVEGLAVARPTLT